MRVPGLDVVDVDCWYWLRFLFRAQLAPWCFSQLEIAKLDPCSRIEKLLGLLELPRAGPGRSVLTATSASCDLATSSVAAD